MKTQFLSGYLLSSVKELLSKSESLVDLDGLFEQLCAFDIEYNFNARQSADSLVAVYENIISRGTPTFPSLFVEETISYVFNIAQREIDKTRLGSIVFRPSDKLTKFIDGIYQSFFVVDPRIVNIEFGRQNYDAFDNQPLNEAEVKFITNTLPQAVSEGFCQLIETQREISTIIRPSARRKLNSCKSLGSVESKFFAQRVDFSFDLPSLDSLPSGLVIEIDGPQHHQQPQESLDDVRDKALVEMGWEPTLRITTKELSLFPSEKEETLENFLDQPYSNMVAQNYANPIWKLPNGLEILQIALSPFAIARVQKSLLFLIQNRVLDMSAEVWKIGVIERDVPCGFLALDDLQRTFEQLFLLEGKGRKLPRIKLKVFRTTQFETCAMNDGVDTHPIEEFDPTVDYDAIVDVSILQRSGFSFPHEIQLPRNKKSLRIRSAHSIITNRKTISAKPIKYLIPKEEQPESLKFFLNNIFRKEEFLEGQVKILRKTLSLDSVIALLPTGAGKSLTYQLSALLQPGITLVVDPIKSLMRDQDQNLRALGIDSTTFINSSISIGERKLRSQEFIEGKYQFVFVSPERLQIQEFREFLGKMTDTYFTYCVVDEAHCVSEWGHDFRTAYLRLGENVRKYCRVFPGTKEIPLVGLTGTASYVVLSDVQRELFITSKYAVISPSKYERRELFFKIEEITKINSIGDGDPWKIKEAVAKAKNQRLREILNQLAFENWKTNTNYHSIDDFFSRSNDYPNAGIVFCPHVGWVFGVKSVASEITSAYPNLREITDIYAGSLAGDDSTVNLELTQNRFKSDEIGLLVATKAFGMGIDKPNVRFTVHFSMPQSIESFYQEAGRAGRDKENSFCYIIHSSSPLPGDGREPVSVDKDLMLSFFHNSFPGPDKEKNVMWELLHEITFPILTISERVSLDELDLEYPITLNLSNEKIVYVDGDFPSCFGSINLQNGQILPETRAAKQIVPVNDALVLLQKVLDQIKTKCPVGETILDWITDKKTTPPQPGYEEILAELQEGESQVVIVPFSNNVICEIAKYVSSLGYGLDEEAVSKKYNFCFSPEEFTKRIFGDKSRCSENQINKVKRLFLKVRGEQETFRAIYRLSVLGIIDDYVVDHNTKTVTTTIIKKKDEEYLNRLAGYIGRYDSPENQAKVFTDIDETRGETMIQKCCGYLTTFVYEKIAAKREEAINVMEIAIKSNNFSEYVNTYFDSSFTPEFRPHLYDNSIEWIWGFLKKKATSQDAISNIRGACDRLLVENPSNPALLLLRSYSKFTNPNYDKSEAIDDLQKSWSTLKQLFQLSESDFLPILTRFSNQAIKYDSSLRGYFDGIFIDYHANWLETFLKSFLKEN